MKIPIIKFFCCLAVALFVFAHVKAQNSETTTTVESEQSKAETACGQISAKAERTYTFRKLPRPNFPRGTYGSPKWYQKLFPFLAQRKLPTDLEIIEKALARPIPLGETKRSKTIRSNAEAKMLELQKNAEQKWQIWLAQNPNRSAEEKRKAEIQIRFQGLAATDLPRFDWRENGLDVGAVGFQGFQCGNCWAFSTVDAMQASRRLSAIRAQRTDFNEELNTSVQQLISCMLPDKKNEYCSSGWHGNAFSYMVDKGFPLGGPSYYREDESTTWTCDSNVYVKALTWDFVSRDPNKVSTTEEIKRALVLYGPVVTMIRTDKCFLLYGGGVFNGENNNDVTHFVLIVGWDDAKGAWLIKNSYGEDWGEKGFGWIKYGSNNVGTATAWVLADPNEEERIFKEFGNGANETN